MRDKTPTDFLRKGGLFEWNASCDIIGRARLSGLPTVAVTREPVPWDFNRTRVVVVAVESSTLHQTVSCVQGPSAAVSEDTQVPVHTASRRCTEAKEFVALREDHVGHVGSESFSSLCCSSYQERK